MEYKYGVSNISKYILKGNAEEYGNEFLNKVLIAAQSNDTKIIDNIPHVIVRTRSKKMLNDFCEGYALIIADYNVLPQKSMHKLAHLNLFCGISKNELKTKLQKVYDLERYKNKYYGTLHITVESGGILQDKEIRSILKEFIDKNRINMKFIFECKEKEEQIFQLVGTSISIKEVELLVKDNSNNYGNIFVEILKEKNADVNKESLEIINNYFEFGDVDERYCEDIEGVQRLASDYYYYLYTEGLTSELITKERLEEFLQSVGTKKYNSKSKIGFC